MGKTEFFPFQRASIIFLIVILVIFLGLTPDRLFGFIVFIVNHYSNA